MKYAALIVLPSLIYAALVAAVVFAGESWGADSRAQAPTKLVGQINVTATRIHAYSATIPPPGRQGDRTEQTWRITDRAGRTIGRMYATCRWVRPRARFCVTEMNLPRGKIVSAGTSISPFEGEYAVLGGTGGYDEAAGVMLFSAIGLRKNVVLINLEN